MTSAPIMMIFPLGHTGVQVLLRISAAVDHGVEDVLGSLAQSLLAAVGQHGNGIEIVAGGAEHQVAAVADAPIRGHVAVDTEVVGLNKAHEAPLPHGGHSSAARSSRQPSSCQCS